MYLPRAYCLLNLKPWNLFALIFDHKITSCGVCLFRKVFVFAKVSDGIFGFVCIRTLPLLSFGHPLPGGEEDLVL